MKTSPWQNPFLLQALSLILIVILVHSIYVVIVRPNAEVVLRQQALAIELNDDTLRPEQSFFTIIKDYEQEACFIMLLWAMVIMGQKALVLQQSRELLVHQLVQVEDGMSILPDDARNFARPVQAMPEQTRALLLPRALLSALQSFAVSRNMQNVSEAVNNTCEQEADRLDSELSMIRYIAWAIPSVGFIGTVRGIGAALGEAHKAVAGDISAVTINLGVAFNSTFVALVLSIILMFLVHQLQLTQERLVSDTRDYVDQRLLRHMKP